MKEGMRIARRRTANGRTVRRYGSRQTKVYTARNERVCDHCFQLSRRITLAWKTKTTPILALNLLKLFDMVVILKAGRSTKFGAVIVASFPFSPRSSIGITCCNNLLSSAES